MQDNGQPSDWPRSKRQAESWLGKPVHGDVPRRRLFARTGSHKPPGGFAAPGIASSRGVYQRKKTGARP